MTIVIVRHGETEWSRTRRHTSRTDVPLTDRGRDQAAALASRLAGLSPSRVLSSPRIRALETCRLAGFGDVVEIDERLVEWDYGDAEGRTTAEIRVEHPDWTVWTHDTGGGESLDAVAARVDALIADLDRADRRDHTTLLFAHAHVLRILGARWCNLPALAGRLLQMEPASVSVLGYEYETRGIQSWNEVHDH
jgi:broad specificity phosphatase PhoE